MRQSVGLVGRLSRRVLVAAALLLPGFACVASPRPVPADDVSPQHQWSPPLVYPQSMRDAGRAGSVLLEGTVDASGRVVPGSVRVLKSSDPAFAPPAIAMLYDSRFLPAQLEGRPVEALVRLPVRFEIQQAGAVAPEDSVAAAEALAEARRMVQEGQVPEAMAAFARARAIDSRLAEDPSFWQPLCWCGSLWGYAREVIGACEHLVSLEPDRLEFIDARGIARALTGEYAAAIADFQVVADRSPDAGLRSERLAWIAALQAGENPLTPERLRAMRGGSE